MTLADYNAHADPGVGRQGVTAVCEHGVPTTWAAGRRIDARFTTIECVLAMPTDTATLIAELDAPESPLRDPWRDG